MVSPFGLALRSGLCFSMVPFLTSFTFVFDSGARSQRVLRASPSCHWNVIGTEHPEVPIANGCVGRVILVIFVFQYGNYSPGSSEFGA